MTTLVCGRYCRRKSRFTVVRPSSARPCIEGECHSLEKDLRQNHCRTAVEVDAVRQPRDRRDEISEVSQAPFADRGSRRLRVHVNDVGADGDMHRHGNPEPPGGRDEALRHEWRLDARPDRRPTDWPIPRPSATPSLMASIQTGAGLLSHSELPWPQCGVDILGRRSGQRDLEVVNDPGAVGGDGRDESPLHQVDEDRRQPGLEHVGADSPNDGATVTAGASHCRDDPFEVGGGQLVGQALDQIPHSGARPVRLGKLSHRHLARPRLERIGADAGEIEFLVGKLHVSIRFVLLSLSFKRSTCSPRNYRTDNDSPRPDDTPPARRRCPRMRRRASEAMNEAGESW